MTFTAKVKEEITFIDNNALEDRILLSSFLKCVGKISKEEILLVTENAKVARLIYRIIKETYNINIYITIRIQKRFRIKQLYMLKINNKVDIIKADLLTNDLLLDNKEEKIAFIKGLFLATGSISDPKSSGYHLEFSIKKKKIVNYIISIIKSLDIVAKSVKRSNGYMIYIKNAEQISDLLKMFNTTSALFYFEDIRIYRDHKNMVNRLNNCELANQEKIINTGIHQINWINDLKNKDIFDLLDDKTKIIAEYRLKYPETSYEELAEIVTMESGYKIGKSGINHHFIKIKKLYEKYI